MSDITHKLASSLRSRFKEHTPTVRRIVSSMTDEELCQEWDETFKMRMEILREWPSR
jgi:hypothetical protein